MRDWLKVSEVAQMLGFSPATIRRLRRQDPSFPKPFRPMQRNGRPRFWRCQIEGWMQTFAAQPSEGDPEE